MAKISLNKITPIKTGEVKNIEINGSEIAIKQYLPLEEKTSLVEKVLNDAADEYDDFGIIKLDTFLVLRIIEAYTNISFTETQLKNIPKLYDSIILNNVWKMVKDNIPEEEITYITRIVYKEAIRIRDYFHSTLGVLQQIKSDYNMSAMDVDGLIDKVKNDQSMGLVRDILTKVN